MDDTVFFHPVAFSLACDRVYSVHEKNKEQTAGHCNAKYKHATTLGTFLMPHFINKKLN